MKEIVLSKNLFYFIWSFLRKEKKYFFWYSFLSLLAGLWNPFNMFLVSRIVVVLSMQSDFQVYNLINICFFIVMNFILFDNITWRGADYCKARFLTNLLNNIEQCLLEYVHCQSAVFFCHNMVGDITKKIYALVDGIYKIFASLLSHFLRMILLLLVTLFFAVKISYLFCFLLTVWILLFFFVSIYISHDLIILSEKKEYLADVCYAQVVDSVVNNLNVKFFGGRDYELKRRLKVLDAWKESYLQNESKLILLHSVQGGMIAIMLVFVMVILIYLYYKGRISIDSFVFVIASFIDTGHMMWWTMSLVQEFYNIYGRCKESLRTLLAPIMILDKPNAESLFCQFGRIEFKGVYFHYNQNENIFNDLSIQIDSCSRVALVGFSGSGKSTFVNLILRMHDVQSGEVLIDGQNVIDVSLRSLYSNITVVSQESILFNRSIYENIIYGNRDASEEEVYVAAKNAFAHEFISMMPDGYSTIVGDRGITLSGGQRQRIAIARAFLKRTKILIFDEASSALDSITERYIQQSLDLLSKDRTVIVIAHRLSTVFNMDRILVFDCGRIVGDGGHQVLLKDSLLYKKLWESQTEYV